MAHYFHDADAPVPIVNEAFASDGSAVVEEVLPNARNAPNAPARLNEEDIAKIEDTYVLGTGFCEFCQQWIENESNFGDWKCWKRLQYTYLNHRLGLTKTVHFAVRSDHKLTLTLRREWNGKLETGIVTVPTEVIQGINAAPRISTAIKAASWYLSKRDYAIGNSITPTTPVALYDIRTEAQVQRTLSTFLQRRSLTAYCSPDWVEESVDYFFKNKTRLKTTATGDFSKQGLDDGRYMVLGMRDQ